MTDTAMLVVEEFIQWHDEILQKVRSTLGVTDPSLTTKLQRRFKHVQNVGI